MCLQDSHMNPKSIWVWEALFWKFRGGDTLQEVLGRFYTDYEISGSGWFEKPENRIVGGFIGIWVKYLVLENYPFVLIGIISVPGMSCHTC